MGTAKPSAISTNFAPHPVSDIILGIFFTIDQFYAAFAIAEDSYRGLDKFLVETVSEIFLSEELSRQPRDVRSNDTKMTTLSTSGSFSARFGLALTERLLILHQILTATVVTK